MSDYELDVQQLTIRLFVEAAKRWDLPFDQCAKVFDDYKIDEYIEDCYEFFHVQGDAANLCDIEDYLASKGYAA